MAEPLYTGASLCENGDVIIKAVNVLEQPQKVLLDIRGMKKREALRAKVEEMSGWEKDAENSFSEPDRIVPEEKMCLLNGSGNGVDFCSAVGDVYQNFWRRMKQWRDICLCTLQVRKKTGSRFIFRSAKTGCPGRT